jgi:hypothetical protein
MKPSFLALISAVLQTAVMVSVIVEWHIRNLLVIGLTATGGVLTAVAAIFVFIEER